ncbi:hypothetical protein RQP54_03465 [Curvibacter sp. APW13]|uniref:hypothetical protein n=1 Tax=Curvibacter sp. APW13 TaxID=3077236 RepID=UPI0028DF61D8|nr:hypothetical protein [Curvibacter sp. APW13]MDT8989913.1 hypothetical protein [Curvibacter sp. APW13]
MDMQRPGLWLSSSDFAPGHFAPHGEFRLCVQGQLVLYEAHGPFNLQAVQGLGAARQALLQHLPPQGRFAAIVHFQGNAVMTADALEAWEQGLKQFAAQRSRIAGVAWVAAPEVEGIHFLLSLYRRIFEEARLPFAFFETMELARAWAAQQLRPV